MLKYVEYFKYIECINSDTSDPQILRQILILWDLVICRTSGGLARGSYENSPVLQSGFLRSAEFRPLGLQCLLERWYSVPASSFISEPYHSVGFSLRTHLEKLPCPEPC